MNEPVIPIGPLLEPGDHPPVAVQPAERSPDHPPPLVPPETPPVRRRFRRCGATGADPRPATDSLSGTPSYARPAMATGPRAAAGALAASVAAPVGTHGRRPPPHPHPDPARPARGPLVRPRRRWHPRAVRGRSAARPRPTRSRPPPAPDAPRPGPVPVPPLARRPGRKTRREVVPPDGVAEWVHDAGGARPVVGPRPPALRGRRPGPDEWGDPVLPTSGPGGVAPAACSAWPTSVSATG